MLLEVNPADGSTLTRSQQPPHGRKLNEIQDRRQKASETGPNLTGDPKTPRAHLSALFQDSSSPSGCPVVVDFRRLLGGNTAGSGWGDRRICWSRPRRSRSVNPSRKLRRFESFTCHHVLKGPLTCGNAGQGPLHVPGGGIESGVAVAVVTIFGCRPV